MQLFFFCNPENYVKRNFTECKKDFKEVKQLLGLKNMDIFWYAAAGNAYLYSKVLREAGLGFIPNHSLLEWMNILDKD